MIVRLVAVLYMLVGAGGVAIHLRDPALALVSVAAVVAGVGMWLGHRWARWLAVAWMGFHVVVGALHSPLQLALHAVFFVLIAWALQPWRSGRGAASAPLP